jgi:thiamine biosynthesis lipoprotein
MSTYDSTSELSRFNGLATTDPVPLSAPTLAVLTTSQHVSEASGGALDVTVAPLVEAWGFGTADEPPEAPPEETLARLLERVGYRALTVDSAAGTATKAHGDLTVDLSAVAKGYAADRVADTLATLGRSIHRVIEVADEAVATSGDYRNVYELDGVLYAHLIDPRTGRPAQHAGASVTVLHESGATADAWATALAVLGPADGLAVAERAGLTAFFITRAEERFFGRATTAFIARFGPPDNEN